VGNALRLDELVAKFSTVPREILGIDVPVIAEGEKANLTVFSIEENTVDSKFQTKGYNIPTLQESLKGKVIRTVHTNF
jgi:dihydroorotase